MSNEAGGCSVTITRTADTNAYAANDVIGAATGSTAAVEFTNMGSSLGNQIMITSARLRINDTGIISGETSYRLHLYNVTPPGALGDNAAWDLPSGDRASYLGFIELGTPVDLGSTLYVEANIINKQISLLGKSIFGYLVTIGGYTPTSARIYVVELQSAVFF
jgi:hypothetical protein